MNSTHLERYAVMGNPIAHSRSPRIHAMFAEQTGQALHYDAVLVPQDGLAVALERFQEHGGKGLNITVPFKHQAWSLMDHRSDRAAQAQAVNTVWFEADGRRMGDNTDGVGLLRDLRDNHAVELRGRRILVLGAGGAVRGILGPLLGERPQSVLVANRTPERAEALAAAFGLPVHACGFPDVPAEAFDVVINGTSASLAGETPPLPEHCIAEHSVCYDLMYAAEPTAFMHWAAQLGATRVMDGLGMLVEQAAESFFLWRGVRPHTAPVIDVLRPSS